MFVSKFNYWVERATLVGIVLWGSWALYYWVAVLVFDASYTSLKTYTPLLLLQIAVSLFYLFRTDLGFSSSSLRTCAVSSQHRARVSKKHFVVASVVAVLLGIGVVLISDHRQWTESAVSYNLLWVALLPISLAYFVYSNPLSSEPAAPTVSANHRAEFLDCLLFLVGAIALAVMAFGSGYPTPDDALYGHIMSSMLAHPELPVQGQDLLQNTSAPYSVHPSYRGVGYEVLMALLGDVLGLSPLHLYFNVFPVFAVVIWVFSAHLFMRAMRAPYPGLAVTVSFLILLFWGANQRHPPSGLLVSLWWGKIQVLQIAAPLLFFTVASFLRRRTFGTWFILLLAVCTIAVRSSTAWFVVPVAVGMAVVVFLPSIRNNLRLVSAVFLSLLPVLLLLLNSLQVLWSTNSVRGDDKTGALELEGVEFGGLAGKSIVLVILLVLPLLARTINDTQFQAFIRRLCLVGVFTVMAPFFVEAIAVLTQLNLLSFRLPAAYPSLLLIGVLASVALVHLNPPAVTGGVAQRKWLVPLVVLVLYGALLGVIERQYAYDTSHMWAEKIYRARWSEAEAARALIPDNAYVAAGHLNELLPIMPEPPGFTSVRHYLTYHKNFLSDREYLDRRYLHKTLQKRLPGKSESLDETMDSIVSAADNLGVTTLVFMPEIASPVSEFNADREAFVAALAVRLVRAGYDCRETPSGMTIVCNR